MPTHLWQPRPIFRMTMTHVVSLLHPNHLLRSLPLTSHWGTFRDALATDDAIHGTHDTVALGRKRTGSLSCVHEEIASRCENLRRAKRTRIIVRFGTVAPTIVEGRLLSDPEKTTTDKCCLRTSRRRERRERWFMKPPRAFRLPGSGLYCRSDHRRTTKAAQNRHTN